MEVIESSIIKIRNNVRCNKLCKADSVLQFIYNLIKAYKKLLTILSEFILLLDDLDKRTFTVNNNDDNSIILLNESIITLHNNIIMLFTSQSHNIQLHNISTTTITMPGYKIYTVEEINNVKQNIHYFINSFRIQSYKGLIKMVFNDDNNLPNNIMFIGHKNGIILSDILEECRNSTLLTIDKIKIIQMKYIQWCNGLQNILNNLCLKT